MDSERVRLSTTADGSPVPGHGQPGQELPEQGKSPPPRRRQLRPEAQQKERPQGQPNQTQAKASMPQILISKLIITLP